MDILSILFAPGIAFVLTLAFGFWLSNSGKPYNGILFNFHKMGYEVTLTIHRLAPILAAIAIVVAVYVLMASSGYTRDLR